MKKIENEVLDLLSDLCGSEAVDTTQSLIEDLVFDSLRMVTLLIMIEDTFEIELDQSDMNPFLLITVQDVIDLAARYVKTEV